MSVDSFPEGDPAHHAAAPVLRRIPLSLRMTVYAIAFLGVVLVLLPWVFLQLDRLVPAIHVEIGQFWRRVGMVWAGLSFVAYGVSSVVLTTKGKGPFVDFDPPRHLVVDGPYRYVRNPIVATLISTQFGEALALSSPAVLLMAMLFVVVCNVQVIKFEEPILRQRYGQAYVDYCANVPRWLPRLTPYFPPASSNPGA